MCHDFRELCDSLVCIFFSIEFVLSRCDTRSDSIDIFQYPAPSHAEYIMGILYSQSLEEKIIRNHIILILSSEYEMDWNIRKNLFGKSRTREE
jgi:hypothetical protein